ncbi:FG-GAP-like repeat-containing protein [Algoriphagus formosus]|uniref:T9SS type A sorting domain-containing protein n=1 Tax=Algoriphagus formosus TaxID=2007308 RepID=A0A4R5V4H0_9BACT|nr:FG-GAP-like repeat-containing protein [Algoriphagus aquimaris]TDK46684.1 T9SS type A sorting domain-containing protein [Algoriphagus aquimaris]
MRSLFLLFFISLLSLPSQGQTAFTFDRSTAVNLESKTLSSPWSGGINSAQIQTIDLNDDGAEEWVVWDINSRQLSVFEKSGEEFIHQPEWAYYFPEDISGFLVLADYNSDGKKDLFTSTARGIKAYQNTSSGNSISFELAQDFLPLDNGSNIQANNLDTPLIQDLDGDGDLDLVIFNFASGDYLEFYENTSIDRSGSPDIDGFAFPVRHWGLFEICACGDISFGQTCAGIDLRVSPTENARIQHAGGHSLLYQDWDGDGISDLLLGRDECDILYFLPNKGTETDPLFDEFSTSLPSLGALPRFPVFHNPELIEGSLIISSNSNEAAAIYGVDFAQSIIRFDGMSNPILQDQVLDLGENTRPFFLGNQNGGKLYLSANVTREGEVLGEILEFDFQNGAFEEKDRFENIRELGLSEVQYLEYTDQTGRVQRLLTGIRFEGNIPQQRIFQLLNNRWTELELSGYQPSRGDYLSLFNYQDQDYLLVAAQNGGLDLYSIDFENLATELLETDFLGFQDNPANRNLAVAVYQKEDPGLYTIDQRGILTYIDNFMQQSQREEVQIQIGGENYPTRFGRNTWITLLPDVLGGNPDLILGTRAGGLIYLKASESAIPPSEGIQLIIYPNPTLGPVKVISNQSGTGRIVNALGQVILSDISLEAGQELEIQSDFYTPGLYIFQFESSNRRQLSKKFWVR